LARCAVRSYSYIFTIAFDHGRNSGRSASGTPGVRRSPRLAEAPHSRRAGRTRFWSATRSSRAPTSSRCAAGAAQMMPASEGLGDGARKRCGSAARSPSSGLRWSRLNRPESGSAGLYPARSDQPPITQDGVRVFVAESKPHPVCSCQRGDSCRS
jgi:hypothetical protein